MARKSALTRTDVLVILIVFAAVVSMAVASYSYSSYVASAIERNALEAVHENSRIETHDLSEILKVRMESVMTNLKIIANSSSVHAQDVPRARLTIEAVQESTGDMTDSYLWLDNEGRLVWSSSFTNATLYQQFLGADRSDRPYFQVPRQTLEPYITSVLVSLDGSPRFFISQPVLSENSEFEGAIVASVQPINVGRFLQSKISPDFQSTTGLVDHTGVIYYASNESQIGMNVFTVEYQSQLPEDLRQQVVDFLQRSLQGETGVEDISGEDVSFTLAHQSVQLDGIDFAMLYITTVHTFEEEVTPIIDSQRTLNTIFIIAVGSIAGAVILMMLSSNKKLTRLVEEKTSELRQTNESLVESNIKLEKANEQLDEHDKMQREFINVAAHELRTPIQPLLGMTELLRNRQESEKAGGVVVSKEEVEMLERNAKRLEKLTQNILDVTRIESNKLVLNKEKFDMNEKILNMIRDTKAGLSKRVTINFAPVPPLYVKADKTRIYEVLANLIGNAAKFTNEGTIDVTLAKEQDFAKITIKDTGRGIDPEIMPKLFTRFVSKSESGTGLGLYVSKNVIEAHGGRMWAENNPGGGATFTFTLPALNE
ncbi:MAG: ATP-binding protein [Thermoproteota archaeon]